MFRSSRPAPERRKLDAEVFKPCGTCGKPFGTRNSQQVYCSRQCRNRHLGYVTSGLDLPSSTVGAVAELAVAVALMADGWQVFRGLSPACFCDLIAIKDGATRYIEVRSGGKNFKGEVRFRKEARLITSEYAVYIHRTKEIFFFPV